MKRFRPLYGVLLVLAFVGLVVVGDYAWEGRLTGPGHERVSPDANGVVRISLAGLDTGEVSFYRFLNAANQEVKFFVGRDSDGVVQVAFDANELCYKLKRGYRHEGDWVTCNKCDKSFRLNEVNAGGGGCKPIPLHHRVEGEQLVLVERDILEGWRYFR